MKAKIKVWRRAFREGVFARDNYACAVCGQKTDDLDAHHITDRNEMPNGGYALENGISLCPECHKKAETFHATGTAEPGFAPEDLYLKIGSSLEKALAASEGLQ